MVSGRRLTTGQHQDQSFGGYSATLFTTAVFGDYSLETRKVESLHQIPLRVRVGTLGFEMPPDLRDDVYHDGKESARDFFAGFIAPRTPENVTGMLKAAHRYMLQELQWANCHLRLGVFRPVPNDKIRLVHTFNHQADDCDDKLEFSVGKGVAGACWQERDIVYCDLDDNNKDWGLDKYQRSHMRRTLTSILCVPMFDQDSIPNTGQPDGSSSLIGILSFDSDERIREFYGPRYSKCREGVREVVARELKR